MGAIESKKEIREQEKKSARWLGSVKDGIVTKRGVKDSFTDEEKLFLKKENTVEVVDDK